MYKDTDVEFFKAHLKTNGGIEIFIKHLLQCGQQNIHTPFDLCREIVGKLGEFTALEGKEIAVLFNVEFLHVLLRNYHVPPKNVTIFVDDAREFEFCKCEYGMVPNVNLFYIDMEKTIAEDGLHTTRGLVMKHFDVMVGNPPYQAANRKQGGVCASHTLWDKFVVKANDLLNDGGYLAFVHPSGWRKPGHKLQKIIVGNRLLYLEIHGEKDGLKTFGAETRYDWYVSQKAKPNGLTTIKGQDGSVVQIDISNWIFIPNYEFSLIQRLMAKEGEEKTEILHSFSEYETRKEWMSNEQSAKFKHPCVYTSKKDGPSFMWSSKRGGHFGTPKVIYSTFRPISVGFCLDIKGEYGLTQFASGIVDTLENLPKIQAALSSDKFRSFCGAMSVGKLEVSTNILRLFRKDFWKEFV